MHSASCKNPAPGPHRPTLQMTTPWRQRDRKLRRSFLERESLFILLRGCQCAFSGRKRLLAVAAACLFGAAGGANAALAACAASGTHPLNVRDCGAHSAEEPGYAAFDSTAAITAALRGSDAIVIPRGTWRVAEVVVRARKNVITDGLRTVIEQIPGSNGPIVLIAGSNVRVGSFYAKGNIASARGEHDHALQIGSTAAISNVVIGDVFGIDIRGDVMYVGGTTAAPVRNVRFGTISGRNILRSIVSITGGTAITGDAVVGGNCGYTTLDIEPNPGSQMPDLIRIREVRGGKVQLASGSPALFVGRVEIESLDLNSKYQSPPRPAFTRPDGSSYFDTDIGVLASSWNLLKIGIYRASYKGWSAFFSAAVPPHPGGTVEIGTYIGVGNGARNETYGEFQCGGCSKLEIDSGTTRLRSLRKPAFTGGASTLYAIRNFDIRRGK